MISKIIEKDIEEIVSEFEENLSSLKGKKILITGGNGFLGSYIVDTFVEINKRLTEPIQIYVLNKNKINNKSRLSHLINNPNVRFIVQDIKNKFELPPKLNIIFHAASPASPDSFLNNPLETIDSNVNGVRNLLEYSKKNPVENFLFFSSGDVYGNPPSEFSSSSEEYFGNVDPLCPRSCYSESKRFAETLCSVFFRKYKVPIKILRIGHTYGPGLRKDKAIHEFFKKSIENKKINLRDKGEASISYCYVSDTIRGILKVMFKGVSGEAYNIGDGSPSISIKDLAELIGKTQKNSTVVNPNYKNEKDNSKEYIRNLNIIKLKVFGFEPKINLEEGLKRLKSHLDEFKGGK